MSFYNPSKNPFPFYQLEGNVWTNFKPLWHKNNCANYLHTLTPGLRYFQLHISPSIISQNEITAVNLRRVSDNSIVPASIGRTIYVEGENKILVINAEITVDMIVDQYYISVSTAYGNFYSETFCVKPANKDLVLLEWRSSTVKVGKMIYPLDVKQSINLNAKIVLLEPEIEEETEENGFGEETATLQVLTQPYFLSCVVPNYLGEALSALKLHDQFIVNNRLVNDNQIEFDEFTKVNNVKVTPETNGCDSYVEITYTKETVIKTTCEGQIIALNNAPFADIVWQNTETTEDRECNVDDVCTQMMMSTDLTMDIDGDDIMLDWERSTDNGLSWISIGGGETKQVTETEANNYSYRLKATDTHGLSGYSNILKYSVFSLQENAIITLHYPVPSDCHTRGTAYPFDITGLPNQSVRFQIEVLLNHGHGFLTTIYERENMNVVYTGVGGVAGSVRTGDLELDELGNGEFLIDLCLRPCLRTGTDMGQIEFRLFDNSGTNLTDQQFKVYRSANC